MPTTRRRSKRLSGSSVNSRVNTFIDAPEPVQGLLSFDEESTTTTENKTRPINTTMFQVGDISKTVLASCQSTLSSLRTLIFSVFKSIAWSFFAIPSLILKWIHHVTKKGKVTVLHKEEHPTRLSRRLRGRPAEEFDLLPNGRRRRLSKPSQMTEVDTESLIDESDIDEASVASLKVSSISQDQVQTKPMSAFEKCRNGLRFLCSMAISPFRLAYFGWNGTSSQQSLHKKNRKSIRALPQEFPSRQSLRLRGQEAENDGHLPTSKRIPRSRRNRLSDIQPLDFNEQDETNFDDTSSVVTILEDESENRNIVPFLILFLLLLPLVMWLVYGIYGRGVHAVREDIMSTAMLVTEYSSQIIWYSYHQAGHVLRYLLGLVSTATTSIREGLYQIATYVFSQIWSITVSAWNGILRISQILLQFNPISTVQPLISKASSNITPYFTSATEYIWNNFVAFKAILKQPTFDIIDVLPSKQVILLVPGYLWNCLQLAAVAPVVSYSSPIEPTFL